MTNQINGEKSQAGSLVAGTLVHTKEGLRPIEEIKVGDYVLSKPDSGEGELAYKRVTRTYEFDDKEIWYLSYANHNDYKNVGDSLVGSFCATGDHPLWLAGFYEEWISEKYCNSIGFFANSWIQLQDIQPGMELQLADNRLVTAEFPYRLIQTQLPELAFFHSDNGNEPYDYGGMLSFTGAKFQLCQGDVKNELGKVILHTCHPNSPGDYINEGVEWEGFSEVKWFKRKVYNLEVEDCRTYFVTKHGVWVRVHAH